MVNALFYKYLFLLINNRSDAGAYIRPEVAKWLFHFIPFAHAGFARTTTMAKGQQRSNKEQKKPKKQKSPAPLAGGVAKPKTLDAIKLK